MLDDWFVTEVDPRLKGKCFLIRFADDFVIGKSGPLVVDLVSFMATGFADFVRLKWTTATEVDNAGFHLWRSERANGEYARITDALIPAEGGPVFGADYGFDDEDVTPGTSYFYQLEDFDTAGRSTVHGPTSAWAGIVNIRANSSDGPLTVSGGENLSITVQMRALENAGASVEQWLAAHTPFGWYSYQAGGWQPGIHRAAVSSVNDLGPVELLDATLPTGWYTFYLAVDDQADGVPQATRMDTVEVRVD